MSNELERLLYKGVLKTGAELISNSSNHLYSLMSELEIKTTYEIYGIADDSSNWFKKKSRPFVEMRGKLAEKKWVSLSSLAPKLKHLAVLIKELKLDAGGVGSDIQRGRVVEELLRLAEEATK